MRLLKVDYQDGLGGAMHYIELNSNKFLEYISREAFTQIVSSANSFETSNEPTNDGTIKTWFKLTL